MSHTILDNGLIAIACLDKVYLIGEDKMLHKWRLVHTIPNSLHGMDVNSINRLEIIKIGLQSQTGSGGIAFALLVNEQTIHPITQNLRNVGQPSQTLQNLNEALPNLCHLAGMLTRAHNLHSTLSLYNLYIQGKSQFILKLLIKFHETITKEKEMFKFKLKNLLQINESSDGGPVPKECSMLELF